MFDDVRMEFKQVLLSLSAFCKYPNIVKTSHTCLPWALNGYIVGVPEAARGAARQGEVCGLPRWRIRRRGLGLNAELEDNSDDEGQGRAHDRAVCGTMSVLWLGGVRASHLLTDVSGAVWHMWSGCALSL